MEVRGSLSSRLPRFDVLFFSILCKEIDKYGVVAKEEGISSSGDVGKMWIEN